MRRTRKSVAILSLLLTVLLGAVSAAWTTTAALAAEPVTQTHVHGSTILVTDNVATHIPPQMIAASQVEPLTASGCTGAPPGLSGQFGVCITVNGSGTYVSTVATSAYASYNGCSAAQLLRNGTVIKQAPTVCYGNPNTYCFGYGCGQAGTMLSATFDFYSSAWFHAGDILCDRYIAEDGTFPFQWNGGSSTPEACETIE